MVRAIDNLLVKLDFDRDDLESVKWRQVYYLAIALAFMTTLVFGYLAVTELID